MSFKLADIYTSVDTRTGFIAKNSAMPHLATTPSDRAIMLEFVKECGNEMARELPHLTNRQRFVTTVSGGCYDISFSVLAPVKCTFDKVPLDLVDGHTARIASEKDNASTPKNYGIYGNQLWLHPKPGTSKEVVLYYRPTTFIGQSDAAFDTDEDLEDDILEFTPDTWKPAIVNYVIAQWLYNHGQTDLAQAPFNDYQQFLIKENISRRSAKTTRRAARYF